MNFHPGLTLLSRTWFFAFVLSLAVSGSIARAQGGGGGGGGGIPPGGGGVNVPGGGGATNPGAGGGAGGGGGAGAATDPSIIAVSGMLTDDTQQAAIAIPNTGTARPTATYLWSIIGGRFLTNDLTQATIGFTAVKAGTLTLTCVVTVTGKQPFSATTTITVIDPSSAGLITAPANVATSATSAAASVPAAQSADRTFRWTVTGAAAGLLTGQNTNAITFRPGDPGVKELTCVVTFNAIRVSVTLRAFVVVQGSGPLVALTVNGGFGGGNYPGGSRVDIFASTPPAGQVFDRWTGDTTVLGNGPLAPFMAHTLITLPSTAVTLTATYKAAAPWTPTTVTAFNPQTNTPANGGTPTTVSTTLTYYIPAGAQGVVLLLHDNGGAIADWFTAPEAALLMRDLVAAGYGVAALNSVNRNTRAWNGQATLAANLDAANFNAALAKFATDGLLAANKPVFLLGFGAGADTASRFGDLLLNATPSRPVRGVVLFCAAGVEAAAVTSRIPELYLLAANDTTLGTAAATTARNNSQLLAGRGMATAVINNAASPVHSGRFRALGVTNAGFTTADAQTLWTAIKNSGLLDENNYVKEIPSTTALTAAVPAAYQTRLSDIGAQLNAAYAEQEFFSDANARIVNFLNARVAGTAAPAAGRLTNLSTRIKLAAAGDTLTLGFTITGTEKATLLIRGIGPALAAFGVPGALTAPRLEVNSGDKLLVANEGWGQAPNVAATISSAASSVGAFPLTAGSGDCAVLLTLSPGGYTATIKGLNGATGDVLAEVYDVSKNTTRLSNLSTLARVSNPGDLLIPGITIAGDQPRTLILRAVGPGLADLGVQGTLGDPNLSVLNSTSQTVDTNNNWSVGGSGPTLTAAFPTIGAFALKANSADAALVDPLTPGGYTLQVGAATAPAGQPSTASPIGLLLVEVYEAP